LAAVEISVTGTDAIAKQLGDAADALIPTIDAAVEAGAELIQDMAITLVPVRTGLLKSTIHVEPTGQMMERLVRAGGGTVTYAAYVEYGTRKMGAQPYMRPSRDASEAEIVNLITRAVLKLLKGI
jgi:HK97 gp10 family phage protein